MTAAVQTLTDADFDAEVGAGESPYLVELWAPWCTPCLTMKPIIERIAERGGDALRVGALDTVENPLTPERLQVVSVPALLVFQGGEVVERILGPRSERHLLAQLDAYLPPTASARS
jgi:thioredoxin 1